MAVKKLVKRKSRKTKPTAKPDVVAASNFLINGMDANIAALRYIIDCRCSLIATLDTLDVMKLTGATTYRAAQDRVRIYKARENVFTAQIETVIRSLEQYKASAQIVRAEAVEDVKGLTVEAIGMDFLVNEARCAGARSAK